MKEQESKSLGLTNVEEADNSQYSQEIVEQREIHGTPFTAVKVLNEQGENWYLQWGGKALSPPRPTFQEIDVFMVTNMWDIIAVFTMALNDRRSEIQKYQNQ